MTTKDEMIAHYEADLRSYEAVVRKLNTLLDGVANALKGEPKPGLMHDWTDLPTLAEQIKTERDLAWPMYENSRGI